MRQNIIRPPKTHNKSTNWIKTFPAYNPIPEPHFHNFEKQKASRKDPFLIILGIAFLIGLLSRLF